MTIARTAPLLDRRTVLGLGAAAVAGTVLGGGLLGAAPAQASTVSTVLPAAPAWGRFAYSGNAAAAGTDRWKWQSLQADLPRPSLAAVPQQHVYVTSAQRPADPDGVTTCVPPDAVHGEWLLRDANGDLITRPGDRMIDPANVDYQAAAAAALVARCRTGGWAGIYLDEVNADPRFGFPGPMPAKYPTLAQWQAAELSFVVAVTTALRVAGYPVVANVGELLASYQVFHHALVAEGVNVSCEVLTYGYAVGSAPKTGADWTYVKDFLALLLATNRQVVVHERQNDPDRIRYSLCTVLLGDSGRTVYGSDAAYSASTSNYPADYARVQRLGAPLGVATQVDAKRTPGLWQRTFTGGRVLVNSAPTAQSAGSVRLAAASAAIILA